MMLLSCKAHECVNFADSAKFATSGSILRSILIPFDNMANNTTGVTGRWDRVAKPPSQNFSTGIFKLNEREFVIGIGENQLFKYNSILDEWRLFLQLPQTINIDSDTKMAIDQNNNQLYLSVNDKSLAKMLVIDIGTGIIRQESPHYHSEIGGNSLINVNGTIHKIGGSDLHVVWNEDRNSWNKMHSEILSDHFHELHAMSVVHVLSKNILLMIGPSFGASAQKKEIITGDRGIWRLDLDTGIWECIDSIKFDFFFCGSVLTADEQYVIILGGMIQDSSTYLESDWIHVLDIRTDDYKLWTSSIRPPHPDGASYQVASSGGKKLSFWMITGSIRQLYEEKEFIGMVAVPSVIIRIINEFQFNATESPERIHWILSGHDIKFETKKEYDEMYDYIEKERNPLRDDGAGHFVISLQHIVSMKSAVTLEDEAEVVRRQDEKLECYIDMVNDRSEDDEDEEDDIYKDPYFMWNPGMV